MSYILDALRKSDQQRQHGATPTLTSVQFSADETRQRKYFLLAGIAGVLFVAGILIGWWRPWQPIQPQAAAPATAPAEESTVVRPSAVSAVAQPPMPPVVVPPAGAANPERIVPSPAAKPAVPPTLPAADAPAAVPAAAPVLTQAAPAADVRTNKTKGDAEVRSGEASAAEKRTGTESKAVATEQKVMSRSELPGSIQQELPRFNVALHAYSSTPSNRLVSVNDQLLHEGDSLSPGLVLEQIRPDDMVFSYKGFRFRQGLQ